MDDGWMTLQEAADACGLSCRTLLAMVRRGELPAEKPEGRPYRIRGADVEAFIEGSRVKRGQLASAPPRIAPERARLDGQGLPADESL
jgi:excisionase family DNA binding protein